MVKKICLLVFATLLAITAVSAASDVAYIYRYDFKIDTNIIDAFSELGLEVDLIQQDDVFGKDFSPYKLIFVGDEIFRKNIPVNDFPSIIANYHHADTWGLTNRNGVSQLVSTSPLSVVKNGELVQVYTRAFKENYIEDHVALSYYYLDKENKAYSLIQIAGTEPTSSGHNGDVISYVNPGSHLENGRIAKEKMCFFGIIESNYWTLEAKEMFKDCAQFVLQEPTPEEQSPEEPSPEPAPEEPSQEESPPVNSFNSSKDAINCRRLSLGDVTADGKVDISDYFHLVLYLKGKISIECKDIADVNGDDTVDFKDSEYIFAYLFQNGPAPGCASFQIGDANTDGMIDLSDAVYITLYLKGERTLKCPNVADVNSDGIIDEEDVRQIQEDLFPSNGEDTGEGDEIDCENLPLGDVNADGKVNIADAIAINLHVHNNALLKCKDLGDVNGDNLVDSRDRDYMLAYLFEGGPAFVDFDCSSLELGDANVDGNLDISDPIFITMYLRGEASLECQDLADVNADNVVDIKDSKYILSYLFEGGPAPISESEIKKHDVSLLDFRDSINKIRLELPDGTRILNNQLKCNEKYRITIVIKNTGDFEEDVIFSNNIGPLDFSHRPVFNFEPGDKKSRIKTVNFTLEEGFYNINVRAILPQDENPQDNTAKRRVFVSCPSD